MTTTLRGAALLLGALLAFGPARANADDAAFAGTSFERHGGQHDFDFEFGSWKAHIRRLVHPLSGSNEWVDYDGTSVVRKVWDGRADLGELDVSGPAGHITGMTLRLYNPQTKQWGISWASARDGALGAPMVGGFDGATGEFFDRETFDGKPIMVRFVFHDLTPSSFAIDQSFSADGGKTWEANWLSTFTRA